MSTQKLRTPIAAILLLLHTILNIASLFVMLSMGQLAHPITILSFALDILLCIMLFMKNTGNALLFVITAYVLKAVVSLIIGFNIANLLTLISYSLVLLLTLAFSEQSIIKADLSKVKECDKVLKKIVMILFLVAPFMRTEYWNNIILLLSTSIGELIFSLLHIFAFVSLVSWIKNPYKEQSEDYGNAYCPMAKHILLYLFTCGIWALIWIYRTTKYLNKAPNSENYNPTNKLLLCIFVPFYQIYWFYKHGQRIDSILQSKNNNSNMATVCLILALFIPLVAVIIMQDKINQLCIQEKKENESGQENRLPSQENVF